MGFSHPTRPPRVAVPPRQVLPAAWSVGARELRSNRERVSATGVDCLHVLHGLRHLNPHNCPISRKRGVAILTRGCT